MISIIEQIFGSYQPISYQVWDPELQAFYEVIPSGLSGVNWPYVLSIIGFLMMLFCVMKILGGILCAK